MDYVPYYRVSTKEQGKSGLGLSAQRNDVQRFLKSDDRIIKEFTEVDSGKNDKRVELQKAIEFCKKNEAKLLIAKLDRLSRNASFIFQLRDTNVDFVCCDIPDANTMSIGIFATMAQHERELISKRTKAALAVRKAKGLKLGNPQNLTDKARAKGWQRIKNKARENENNKRATAVIILLMNEKDDNGKRLNSYNAIAQELNAQNFRTSTGKQFHKETVRRLYERAKKTEADNLLNDTLDNSKNVISIFKKKITISSQNKKVK